MIRHTLLSNRKRWAWLCLLVFGALVLLSACGSSSTTTGADNTPTVAPTATAAGCASSRYGSGDSCTPTPATAASPTTGPTGPTQTIIIRNADPTHYGFSPAAMTIAVGTTVIWQNKTAAPHTVTSDSGTTLAGMIDAGSGTFSFTFTQAGTYAYHCSFHPYMMATITVQ